MDLQTLRERQSWTLEQKIDHSLGVIDQFISRLNGKVYLAFSGGKDSTVLMHLCEMIKKDILCVFVNTGCESPDIVRFVNKMKAQGHNIKVITPKLRPREVWAKYGFPIASKEAAEQIRCIRMNPNTVKARTALGQGKKTMFTLANRWKYLLTTPYNTSNKCCDILKKNPSHIFERRSGLHPILGTMADESKLREKTYIRRGGCNVFTTNRLGGGYFFLAACDMDRKRYLGFHKEEQY